MRPTQSELIERIEQCYLGADVTNRVYELLHDILCHLADPWIPPSIEPDKSMADENGRIYGLIAAEGYEVPYRCTAIWTGVEWKDAFGNAIANVTGWCPLPPLPTKGE